MKAVTFRRWNKTDAMRADSTEFYPHQNQTALKIPLPFL